jgi:hypothetical protein
MATLAVSAKQRGAWRRCRGKHGGIAPTPIFAHRPNPDRPNPDRPNPVRAVPPCPPVHRNAPIVPAMHQSQKSHRKFYLHAISYVRSRSADILDRLGHPRRQYLMPSLDHPHIILNPNANSMPTRINFRLTLHRLNQRRNIKSWLHR